MKTTILATFALSTLLFIACNSGSSGKNNSAPDNEMEHMERAPNTTKRIT